MRSFSPESFEWHQVLSSVREAVEQKVVPKPRRERVCNEARKARFTLRQGPGVLCPVQHGEIVCPSLGEQSIVVYFDDLTVYLVSSPLGADLAAPEIAFEDDRTLAERCGEPL